MFHVKHTMDSLKNRIRTFLVLIDAWYQSESNPDPVRRVMVLKEVYERFEGFDVTVRRKGTEVVKRFEEGIIKWM